MEPVPVTRTVRRTVRMAVALVVGQALLCALIGWLTLGKSRPDPSGRTGSVVDQLAAPPPAGPPPPSARTAIAPATTQARRPAPVTATTTRPVPRKTVTSSAVPDRAPATDRPVPILIPPESPAPKTSAPEPLPPSPPPSSASPSPSNATPAPSPTPDLVRDPVEVGDECRPVGAYGRTAEDVLVRCVREWGHRPRWKIV